MMKLFKEVVYSFALALPLGTLIATEPFWGPVARGWLS